MDVKLDNADWLKRMPSVSDDFRERVRQQLRKLSWSEERITALPLFRSIRFDGPSV